MNSSPPLIGVVDDDLAVCDAIKSCLEVDGFHVRSWTSGEAFLADPGLSAIRLLLLDWKMQPIDGLKVAERLIALPVRPIIVLMTGFRVDQIRDEATSIGVNYVLQKPLEGKSLSELVTFMLG